jgi:segregation and condensation protein A
VTAVETDLPLESQDGDGFHVHLAVFEGPFDLLLSLIAKHKLDVTTVALAQVTDEFIAYLRTSDLTDDLDQTTEFLVVAATLLDLKAARLLPAGDVEDEEDLALLEARDLLFARLLQYRAYKEAAAIFAARLADESHRFPRSVGLDPGLADLLPEVLLGIGPDEFAALAARALRPKPAQVVSIDHIHLPRVSVQEQAGFIVDMLRRSGAATFRSLTRDCSDTLTVVARFLALLELFREGVIGFDQVAALGELNVRWLGGERTDIAVTDEFDVEHAPSDDKVDGVVAADTDAASTDAASTDATAIGMDGAPDLADERSEGDDD